jgi:gluconolactonase
MNRCLRILPWSALVAALALVAVSAVSAQGDKKIVKEGDMKILKAGKLVSENAKFYDLVPKDAKVEVIVEGQVWTEGPAWVKDGNYLLYSDIPRNTVYKWEEGKGASVFLKPSGYTGTEKRENEDGSDEPGSNGLIITPNGKALILCQHGDRKLARTSLAKPGKFKYLAESYEGKRLNSPNDAVFHSNGDLYFTDPPYGMKKRWEDPARELDYCGVYRVTKGKKLELLTKEMSRPNGIALSADEKTLVVANSDPAAAIWKIFHVNDDGTLGEGKVLKDVTTSVGKMPGLPDGMTIDAAGNLYATGPGGVYVFSAKGEYLGLIYTNERTSNCVFGGENGDTLYMTTDDYVTRIKLNTKGKGF